MNGFCSLFLHARYDDMLILVAMLALIALCAIGLSAFLLYKFFKFVSDFLKRRKDEA